MKLNRIFAFIFLAFAFAACNKKNTELFNDGIYTGIGNGRELSSETTGFQKPKSFLPTTLQKSLFLPKMNFSTTSFKTATQTSWT